MVAVTRAPPSQSDGSGSIVLALFNIQSGHNGSLEAALRAIDQLGVDIGFLVETKLMRGIYLALLGVQRPRLDRNVIKLRGDCPLLEGQYFVQG